MSEFVPSTATYKWKIPSLSSKDRQLLSQWHARVYSHSRSDYPSDITQIIATFISPNESYTLNQIKTADAELFSSRMFEAHGLKWCLKFDPSNDAYLELFLVSFPPKLSTISTEISLDLEEVEDAKDLIHESFTKDTRRWGWRSGTLNISDFKDLEQLTFKVAISVVTIYNDQGHDVTTDWNNELPMKDDVKMPAALDLQSELHELMTVCASISQRIDGVEQRLGRIESLLEATDGLDIEGKLVRINTEIEQTNKNIRQLLYKSITCIVAVIAMVLCFVM